MADDNKVTLDLPAALKLAASESAPVGVRAFGCLAAARLLIGSDGEAIGSDMEDLVVSMAIEVVRSLGAEESVDG